MSRLVAIDTATWWGGVALVESSAGSSVPEVVAEAGLRVRDSHSAHVLSLLQALLAEAGWERGTVDAYAATHGPGSFTGIRIGLGTVRGLGLATGRPCLGVGTLDALAEAHGPDDRVLVPLLDAGRGEVYGARFRDGAPDGDPWVGPPEQAVDPAGSPAVVFGPGAVPYRARILACDPRSVVRPGPTSVAAAAGRLAAARLAAGARDGDGLAPVYVRPPDAVVKSARS